MFNGRDFVNIIVFEDNAEDCEDDLLVGEGDNK